MHYTTKNLIIITFYQKIKGYGTWTRTKITSSRGMGPTIRRSRNILNLTHFPYNIKVLFDIINLWTHIIGIHN